jgi:hypothetical protein
VDAVWAATYSYGGIKKYELPGGAFGGSEDLEFLEQSDVLGDGVSGDGFDSRINAPQA